MALRSHAISAVFTLTVGACACERPAPPPQPVPAPIEAQKPPAPVETPPADGVVPGEASIQCSLDPSGAPVTIPEAERVEGLAATLADPKSPLLTVGCPNDMRCCMLPGGDRGGQYVTFVDRHDPASRRQTQRVQIVGALRMVKGPAGEGIEVREVWVDTLTLGMRVARSSSVALTPVGDAAGPTQVYAFREGDHIVAIVPTRGGLWGYDDEGKKRSDEFGGTTCDFMTFALAPVPGAGWTPPMVMVGPLKTYRAGESVPYAGAQVRIEIQALRSAESEPPRVRVTSQPWSERRAGADAG